MSFYAHNLYQYSVCELALFTSQNWTKVNKPASAGRSVQWPEWRHGHASSQIKGSVFLMVGGDRGFRLCDVWLCDSTTKLWKQVNTIILIEYSLNTHSPP